MYIFVHLCFSADEAFDTLRTRPEFAVFFFDAEANVLCESRPLAEIVRCVWLWVGWVEGVSGVESIIRIDHDQISISFIAAIILFHHTL
jgi:hypothetical protein